MTTEQLQTQITERLLQLELDMVYARSSGDAKRLAELCARHDALNTAHQVNQYALAMETV